MVTGAIESPKRLEDLHVRRDLVASLLLRTLAFADQLTGSALEQRLGLPFETFSPLIDEFEKNQLMDTRGVSDDPTLEGRPYAVKMNYAISAASGQSPPPLVSSSCSSSISPTTFRTATTRPRASGRPTRASWSSTTSGARKFRRCGCSTASSSRWRRESTTSTSRPLAARSSCP